MAQKTESSSFLWGTIFKILVSGSLMMWLFSRIEMMKVWETVRHLNTRILGIVLILIWLTLFAIAKRWQLIVRLGNRRAPLSKLTEATFIGAFFNQFLPSSVGGDFFRILAVRRQGISLNEAVTGVFMDRLFGFISLGLLCVLVAPLEGHALMNSDLKWPFFLTLFLFFCVLGGSGILLLIPQTWHLYTFLRPFSPLIEMMRRAIHHKILLMSILSASLLSSILLIAGLQILMNAFDMGITLEQGTVILPVVLLLTSLPISFAGWGLREGAMVIALGIYGVPQEKALALSLVYGTLHLISGIPGLTLWIFEKHRMAELRIISSKET